LIGEAEKAARIKSENRVFTQIEKIYDNHIIHYVNNWDLVDLSSYALMKLIWKGRGDSPKKIHSCLEEWTSAPFSSASESLWPCRVAMVSTLALIKDGILEETFYLAEKLKTHPHDLIHKASGWALREAGKKDAALLYVFLEIHASTLPRTALRYAIERLPLEERLYWMKKKKK
jgi:3-methyladenine DNA glycosylase AlkD